MFLFKRKEQPPVISAVVAAAGSASRMDGIDKLMISLREVPVLVRTVEALSACERIAEIVLVCRGELIADVYALVREWDLYKVSKVVDGGENRQQSVLNGVNACSPDARYYVIHDGARPLIEPGLVDDCIDMAIEHGAATAGTVPKDTIKVSDDAGFVTATPNRDSLRAIQTPQVFEAALYRDAIARAQRDGRVYTDDCQLVENAGKRVFVVPGSYTNIKITTPEDLALAEALLICREEGLEWIVE